MPWERLGSMMHRLNEAGMRTKIVAGGLGLVALATAIAVPVVVLGGPGVSPADIFHAEACDRPPAIDPPVLSTAPGGGGRLAMPAARSCAQLTPVKRDAAGIAINTDFIFTASQAISAVLLEQQLVSTPPVPLSISPETATRLRVSPRFPLARGTVYRFEFLDGPGGRPIERWAFQTQSPLRVVQTLPRDGSTDVPINSGVELTFSHDGVTGVEDRFDITPDTPGRFEIHKRVVVFVPKQLKGRTLYTIALRPGVSIDGSKERIDRPWSFRFETGVDERSGATPEDPLLQFGRGVWESATREAPVVSLFFANATPSTLPTVPFTVYRFRDVDAFLSSLDGFTRIPDWAGATRTNYVAPTSGLTQAASFRAKPQQLGDEGDLYVRFPDRLPAGFYLVRAEHAGVKIQSWLQVTDLATYAAVSGARTLVWVNDLASGRALAGASVRVVKGKSSFATDGTGLVSFPTPAELLTLRPDALGESAEVTGDLLISSGSRLAVVPLADIFSGFHSFDFREYSFAGDPTPYWRFLYADRNLYRTTDEVRFWGLVRRRTGPIGNQAITVEIRGTLPESDTEVTVASTPVRSSRRGTFIGTIPFAAATPGYYNLVARAGDQILASEYIEIADFVKPAYRIDVRASKNAILSGQPVDYHIEASFFEGSPVPGLGLSYALDYSDERTNITTGARGDALVRRRPTASQIEFERLEAFPASAEEGEISGGTTVQIFPSSVALEAEGSYVRGRGRVEGTVFNVDFTRLNGGAAADVWDYQGSAAAGRRVTATVTEVSYRATRSGYSYDFVSKMTVPHYTYTEVKKAHGSYAAVADARGRFALSFSADAKRSYSVDLVVRDSAGRRFEYSTSLYTGFEVHNTFSYVAGLTEGPYTVGDAVSVAMRRGQSDLPSGGGNRYLFYTAANGIRTARVGTSAHFTHRFSEADVPNVEVLAVRFNGVTYEEAASGYGAVFDQETRRLRITVTPDKPRYRPGQTATLGVRVTDASGRPARAEVLLSAVDEALYRVSPDAFFSDRDILTTLYETISSGVLRAYASHQFPFAYGGGEMGGEGPDRTNFRDVGIFTRVIVGASGRASVPFKLPDNLTSWRVTALAVSDRLQAGTSTTQVRVGLPVFVDVGMNDSYLVSDHPSIRLRAFGTDLRPGDRASFRVEAPTLSRGATTVSGTAFSPVDVPLPALREGTHKIRITVSARGHADTIVRAITVLRTRLLRVEAHDRELAPGERFFPEGSSESTTRVVVTDHNRGRYYPAISELAWTYGDRVDQMMARNLSKGLLARYFGEPSLFPAVFRPSDYQTPQGGIAIFPFADSELTISARLAALAPNAFGREGLAEYFRLILSDRNETRERGTIALYGSAALGEPVLLDVQRLAREKDLGVREKLYVGLAALTLGDETTARTVYRGLLDRYAEIRGATIRLNVGKDQDDVLEATSLGAILGAGLADDAAPALFEYTSNNRTTDLLVELERISYLTAALPRLSGAPSRVSYTLAGKRVSRSLARGESLALSLTAKQRKELDLVVEQGRVGVSTSFLSAFAAANVRSDPDVSISRTLNGAKDRLRIGEADLVRIELTVEFGPKAIDGCYQLSDLLPSGLRAVQRPYDRGIEDKQLAYPYAIEGQRVSFCAGQGGAKLVYYARAIGRGTYTAEPALIQAQRGSERTSLSGSLRLEIG
jgi:alpha-2-macroglobulin